MEPNNNSSGFVRFGKFETFIARLAGYDLKILADEKLGLDRTEITHEKIKLVRIGISVLIPSFFGFLSSLYYFSTVVEGEKFYKITDSLTIADSWLRLAAAIVIASLLLVIDCIIVTTLSKKRPFGLVIRILISLCLSMVISEPMVLFIFNKTINQSLRLHLEELRSIDERSYNNEIQKLTDKIKENEEDKNSAKSKLQEYDSGNIIKKRITKLEQDAQDRRNAWMQQQRMYAHDIQEQVNLKNDEIDKLMNARRSNADLIQAKQIERQKEIRGELSGKPGIGSVVNSIDNAINSLNQRQNEIDRDIQRIRNDIEELGTHKQSTPPDLSIDRSALNEELTFSESADKKDQEERIKVSDQKIKEINRQIQTIQSEKEKLKDTYAIDKHNDTIQQTRALFRAILSNSDNHQHINENQVGNAVPSANKNGGNNLFLLFKVLALFFLVFFIDTVPTITKLTVKTRYDDYFSGLEMERAIHSMDINHEEGRKMIDLIEQTNSDLSRKLKAGFSDGISEHQMLPQDQMLAQRIIAKTIYSNYRNLSTLFQSDEHVFEFPLRILMFFRRFLLKIPFISWFFKD